MMRTVKIGKDPFLKKDIKKIHYTPKELPKVQLFSGKDVIMGNPESNLAIGAIYTWKEENVPEGIRKFIEKVSNYAAMTGYWRTTNGAKYVFSNILANPNINKLMLLVFSQKDNGHLLVDALKNFWMNGTDKNKIIIKTKASNPQFTGVTKEGLERIRKQCDLVIIRNIKREQYEIVEKILEYGIDYPSRGLDLNEDMGIKIEFLSQIIQNNMLYDDGCRFDEPFYMDQPMNHAKEDRAEGIDEAIIMLSKSMFLEGKMKSGQEKRIICEKSISSIMINDALRSIPKGYDPNNLKKAYLCLLLGKQGYPLLKKYHNRIFEKWGNQVEKMINCLNKDPTEKNASISLWDQDKDMGNPDSVKLFRLESRIEDGSFLMHAISRNIHVADVTKGGKLINVGVEIIPLIYALASLQDEISKRMNLIKGEFRLTIIDGFVACTR